MFRSVPVHSPLEDRVALVPQPSADAPMPDASGTGRLVTQTTGREQ